MDGSNEMRDLLAVVRRQWYIVAVAMAVAVVAAGVYVATKAKPETTYAATSHVNLINGTSEIVGLPTIDAMIASVSSDEVREFTAERLGVAPGKVPAASAEVNAKNTRVVDITVKSPDRAAAERAAEAYAQAVRKRVLVEMYPQMDYTERKIESLKARVDRLDARIAEVRKRLSSRNLTAAERIAYESMAFQLEEAKFEPEDEIQSSELALAQYAQYVYVDGEPKVKRSAPAGALASDLLRAAVLGLLAGLGLAWVRERRTT